MKMTIGLFRSSNSTAAPGARRVLRHLLVAGFIAALTSGCGGVSAGGGGTTTGNPFVEDSSTSGVAAGAVGGALSGSGTSGTQALQIRQLHSNFAWRSLQMQSSLLPEANAAIDLGLDAAGVCPTFKSTDPSLCSVDGSSMMLSYSQCRFVGSATIWQGALALTPSTGTPACGGFPNPGAGGSLYRQYVSSSTTNTPRMALVVSKFGTDMTVDDATLNLGNYDRVPIGTITNSGYGTGVTFNASGERSALTIGHHITTNLGLDHSVAGTLTIVETPDLSSRQISGNLTVYHNQLRVTGTSKFVNVMHDNFCCLPVSGSIQTTFSRGTTDPTAEGLKLVGLTETLTFTSCGVGTLQSYDGTTSTVTLSKCY